MKLLFLDITQKAVLVIIADWKKYTGDELYFRPRCTFQTASKRGGTQRMAVLLSSELGTVR